MIIVDVENLKTEEEFLALKALKQLKRYKDVYKDVFKDGERMEDW